MPEMYNNSNSNLLKFKLICVTVVLSHSLDFTSFESLFHNSFKEEKTFHSKVFWTSNNMLLTSAGSWETLI
jgi:hypothetical protein